MLNITINGFENGGDNMWINQFLGNMRYDNNLWYYNEEL